MRYNVINSGGTIRIYIYLVVSHVDGFDIVDNIRMKNLILIIRSLSVDITKASATFRSRTFFLESESRSGPREGTEFSLIYSELIPTNIQQRV